MKKFFLSSNCVEEEITGEVLERAITGAMACNGPCAKYHPARKNCWGATKKGQLVWHCIENGNSLPIARPSTREEIIAHLEAGGGVYTSPYMGAAHLRYGEEKVRKQVAQVEIPEPTSCWECGGKLDRWGTCRVCGERVVDR